jgi:hypothetical protein
MKAYFITGTQADQYNSNKIVVLKMSELHRTKYDDDSGNSTTSMNVFWFHEIEEEDDEDETTDDNPGDTLQLCVYLSSL